MQGNAHYHLTIPIPDHLVAPNIAQGGKFVTKERFASREQAGTARSQLSAQDNIPIDDIGIRRCTKDCV